MIQICNVCLPTYRSQEQTRCFSLVALNLLNVAVKDKRNKPLGYGYIKLRGAKLVSKCMKTDLGLVEEMFVNADSDCIYIRCFGVQFSFHTVCQFREVQKFAASSLNIVV